MSLFKKKKSPADATAPAAPETEAAASAADTPVSPATAGEATEDTPRSEEQKVIQALRTITQDDNEDADEDMRLSLSSILGGDILGGQWFRRNIIYILMVIVMIIVYVSNRYACQREMIESKVLNDTLLDRRYKALTRSSQLKEKTRRSNIEEVVPDSAIRTANTPSFNLRLDQ